MLIISDLVNNINCTSDHVSNILNNSYIHRSDLYHIFVVRNSGLFLLLSLRVWQGCLFPWDQVAQANESSFNIITSGN